MILFENNEDLQQTISIANINPVFSRGIKYQFIIISRAITLYTNSTPTLGTFVYDIKKNGSIYYNSIKIILNNFIFRLNDI